MVVLKIGGRSLMKNFRFDTITLLRNYDNYRETIVHLGSSVGKSAVIKYHQLLSKELREIVFRPSSNSFILCLLKLFLGIAL